MKALIVGGTGMVGNLVLTNCLKSDKISEVISLVRKPTGQSHSKLNEVIITKFDDYSEHEDLFKNVDVTFFLYRSLYQTSTRQTL